MFSWIAGFLEYIDPISILNNYQMDIQDFPTPAFSNVFRIFDIQDFEISPNHMFEKWFGISWIIWSHLVSPKLNIIGFGSHGHLQKSEKHEKDRFSVYPKWNPKVTPPKRSRIALQSLWANFSIKFTIKMAPQTLPDPKSDIFLGFLRFSIGNLIFSVEPMGSWLKPRSP